MSRDLPIWRYCNRWKKWIYSRSGTKTNWWRSTITLILSSNYTSKVIVSNICFCNMTCRILWFWWFDDAGPRLFLYNQGGRGLVGVVVWHGIYMQSAACLREDWVEYQFAKTAGTDWSPIREWMVWIWRDDSWIPRIALFVAQLSTGDIIFNAGDGAS
jgi:hypothetical protein